MRAELKSVRVVACANKTEDLQGPNSQRQRTTPSSQLKEKNIYAPVKGACAKVEGQTARTICLGDRHGQGWTPCSGTKYSTKYALPEKNATMIRLASKEDRDGGGGLTSASCVI